MRLLAAVTAILVAAAPLAAQERSTDYTAPHQVRALEIYRTLIGMRTAAGHGQVPVAAEYLAELFRDAGFPSEDVHVLAATSEDGEAVASLVVRYRGVGSTGLRPILLLAHMDVVDALPEDWERNPFELIEEDGYFFGRGTADDKYGVVMLTATFLRLREEQFVPTRDLILAFTGDEETGMATTQAIASTHRALTDAEFALNADAGGGVLDEEGNPRNYLVQTAEKTYATFELTATNPGGHSSTPRTDNAIYDLTDALQRLKSHRFAVMTNEATRAYFEAAGRVTAGDLGDAMRRFAEDPTDSAAADVLWHEPSAVGITRTTCVPTMLRGGHAENALPQSVTATVNCRIFPGVEVADVEAELRSVAANPHIEMRVLGNPVAGPASPIRADVMDAVAAGVEAIRPGTPILPYLAPYGTDGMHLRRAGIPTYGILGMFMKDSDQFAHGLDERVPVRGFFDGLEFWHVVLRSIAGGAV